MTQPPDPGASARLRALAALLVLAVLVVACIWLAGALRREAAREDCLAGGRRDCAEATSGRESADETRRRAVEAA